MQKVLRGNYMGRHGGVVTGSSEALALAPRVCGLGAKISFRNASHKPLERICIKEKLWKTYKLMYPHLRRVTFTKVCTMIMTMMRLLQTV